MPGMDGFDVLRAIGADGVADGVSQMRERLTK
jgi:hypothetical protein